MASVKSYKADSEYLKKDFLYNSLCKFYDNNENISTINKSKKLTLSRNRSLTVKTINYKKFFKLLIVGCISIIALVLIIDTFKSSIKFFIPNIDFYLNNLYQSLIDIKLFITDLLK